MAYQDIERWQQMSKDELYQELVKLYGGGMMTKTIKQLSEEIDMIIGNINRDLQISTPSKIFQKAASVMAGFSTVSFPGLTSMVNESIEQNRLLEEIVHITGRTTDEIIEFCQSHPYSLEDVRNMVAMGEERSIESLAEICQYIMESLSEGLTPQE